MTFFVYFFNEFFQNNKAFFEGNPKGFGLWIWKPFLVNWYLNNELNDDDIKNLNNLPNYKNNSLNFSFLSLNCNLIAIYSYLRKGH